MRGTAQAKDFPPERARIEVPFAVASFADPIRQIPPREFVERSHNVMQWSDYASVGHFPFYEMSAEYVEDVRRFNRLLHKRNR
jgi:hypothetical protein